MVQAFEIKDLNLSKTEVLHETVRVWSFDFRNGWILLGSLILLYFLPINLWIKIGFLPILGWYGLYSIRQKWRLSLTNKRLVARRLYPRPLNYFLTRIHNFPFQHIEGLSVGPKNNITIFLIGLFLGAGLGTNILKSSLSEILDLPDSLEFIIFTMKLIPLLRPDAFYLESELDDFYRDTARELMTLIGIIFILGGFMLILISFPWRQFLIVRVRYAKDFRLRTSLSPSFIKVCYSRLYNTPIVKSPKKYQKWRFPWLENEKVEKFADMEQILYANRIIGAFAVVVGSIRIWHGIQNLDNFTSLQFVLWLAVAIVDLIVVTLSFIFSKRSSDMVITNKRIIFAQEINQISGVLGRRYFFISDLRRGDIASFDFRKVSVFAIEYLLAAIFVFYLTFSLLILTGSLLTTTGLIVTIFFLLVSLLLLAFVYQTYVGFGLRTKSGDKWVMRHQLANPATRLRQFVGDEQSVFSRLLANRLEEKKIINLVQILRAGDVNLKPRDFETIISEDLTSVEDNPKRNLQEALSSRVLKEPYKREGSKGKRIQLRLSDLLLKNEKVIWERIIPYPLNRRAISITFGTFIFLLSTPSLLVVAFKVEIDVTNEIFRINGVNFVLLFIVILSLIILYSLFILKYYSLRRKSIVVTRDRIFYEEIVQPPKWLFFLGIFRESYIKESLIEHLQSVNTGKTINNKFGWDKFVQYLKKTGIWFILYMVALYFFLLTESYWKFLPASNQIEFLFQIMLFFCSLQLIWNVTNTIVQLVQAWPSVELNAVGIGVNFLLPYLNIQQAQNAQYIIWTGIGPTEKLRSRILRKQLREFRRDQRKAKEDK